MVSGQLTLYYLEGHKQTNLQPPKLQTHSTAPDVCSPRVSYAGVCRFEQFGLHYSNSISSLCSNLSLLWLGQQFLTWRTRGFWAWGSYRISVKPNVLHAGIWPDTGDSSAVLRVAALENLSGTPRWVWDLTVHEQGHRTLGLCSSKSGRVTTQGEWGVAGVESQLRWQVHLAHFSTTVRRSLSFWVWHSRCIKKKKKWTLQLSQHGFETEFCSSLKHI